ncbi:Membrane carboxypeptidase (penicillin-binding protein) [Blastococcus sp. DSM 46786]|uniref:transglycosylase domain-containing protein n=1 Tax=Blastococcus sp. DSM 46786 TaxID=1798227 RepID=UPI0008D46A6B|nr:transglycosylase domain-containing protein [Blastococcus sp. DSM 46786]SEK91168.1 Membrane carboxypeptidase (penicillin-binding protein) [Blastococcus sp. DSM 46786]
MESRTGTGRTLLRLACAVLLAGALVAGLLLPWVGGPALAARGSSALLGDPPEEFSVEVPARNTVVLAANGEVITSFYRENREPVEFDRIAEVMRQALVAVEDARFYDHGGLDVQGTARALVTNIAAGEVEEGGSTLTQQLVKQTLLQSARTQAERDAATEKTFGRKLREARLALAMESTYTKDELLTRYLNIVYFGQNAYGVQPAARAFFGVDAAELTLPQAALLAGLVQSPKDHDPFTDPEGATIRRNLVLARMAEQGYISPEQQAEASAAPLGLAPVPAPRRGCVEASVGAYVCDFVQQYLIEELGLTQDDLERNGYVVQTTLDADLQRAGDAAVLANQPLESSLAATFTAVEPGTGHLLAMSVNRIYGHDEGDLRQESVNLNALPSRGAGSTYKVFVAAAALARGYSTEYTLTAPSPYISRVYREGDGPYDVRNSGSYRASLDLTTALYQSSNTYFLALEDALGSVEEPVRMAERMGLYAYGPSGLAQRTIDQNNGSFAFGPEATSPLGLASAYSTLAASGTRCDVVPVTALLDREGEPVLGPDGEPLVGGDRCTPEAIPPGVADTLNQMLRKDVEPGYGGQTGRRAYVPGHQIAGKTGTTQQNVSVAFVGYTPEIAASVMVFNPKEAEDVGGFGGGKGATIWHDAMAPILTARGSSDFPPADPTVVRGNTIRVPSCDDPLRCQDVLGDAGFLHRVFRVDSDLAPGALVGTSPPAGGRAVPGQVIAILVSNGSRYVPPPPPPPPAPEPPPAPVPDPATVPPAPPVPQDPGARPGGPQAPDEPVSADAWFDRFPYPPPRR